MENKINEIEFSALIAKLKRLVRYLISKSVVIFLIAILLGGFGYYQGLTKKQNYVATLTFISENNGSDKLSAYSGIASQFGIDLGGNSGGGIFEGENLNEFFKSRYAIAKTLVLAVSPADSTTLLDLYVKNHRLVDSSQFSMIHSLQKSKAPSRYFDSLINSIHYKILLSQIKIEKKDKKVGIITLEFKDTDEYFAKLFLEKLSDFVIDYYISYKTKNASKNLNLLQNQADSLRELLNYSIEGEAQNNDLNINPLKQVLKVPSSKSRIDITANSTMYNEVVKQLAIAKISLLKETPLIQIIDKPIMPLAKVGFGKIMKFLIYFFVGAFLSISYFGCRFLLKNI
jgi:hypothetical protein